MQGSRQYSTISHPTPNLDPWTVTGFYDAEGSFILSIYPHSNYKTNYNIILTFSLNLNLIDLPLIEELQKFFGVGYITISGNSVLYRVSSIADLEIIIAHFDKYPLLTNKYLDYNLFRKAFELIKAGQHLTEKGLLKLVGIKYSLNKGLSKNLIKAFPNIIPEPRGMFEFKGLTDPNWLAGFISGDGSFFVRFTHNEEGILKQVRLFFSIGQHIREFEVITGITTYLGINFHPISKEGLYIEAVNDGLKGNKYVTVYKDSVTLKITALSIINSTIIPFFNNNPLIGQKADNFALFKIIATMVQNKEHLTIAGSIKIKEIVSKMNHYV